MTHRSLPASFAALALLALAGCADLSRPHTITIAPDAMPQMKAPDAPPPAPTPAPAGGVAEAPKGG